MNDRQYFQLFIHHLPILLWRQRLLQSRPLGFSALLCFGACLFFAPGPKLSLIHSRAGFMLSRCVTSKLPENFSCAIWKDISC